MPNHTFTRFLSLPTTVLSSVIAIVILLACVTVSQAQDDNQEIMPARGFHPTHGYSLGDIETISTTSGNLMLNIPLGSLPPGRGGHPGFQLMLRYNSKVWDGEADVAENPLNPNQTVNVVWLVESNEGGWHYNIPKNYYFHVDNRNSHGVFFPPPDIKNTHIWKLKMMFPDGSAREMRPYGFDDGANDGYFAVQPQPGMSYYSTDGSYLRLDIGSNGAWTLNFPNGSKVINVSSGVQRAVDRHGAYIERTEVANYNNTGHSADVISDQLGRTIVIEYGTNEDYIRVPGVGGIEIMTTVKWGRTFVSKEYRAGNHFQYNVNLNLGLRVVSEIDMPVQLGAGLKYLFGYNGNTASGMGTSVGWGELSSVTLPSGANVTYQYDMDNQSGTLTQANWVLDNAPSRKTLNYTLEYDNTTAAAPPEIWQYNIGNSGASTISPDGGVTFEFFMPSPTLGRVYKTRQPDGSVIERVWKENRPFLPPGVTIFSGAVVNPFVEVELLSIPDIGGNLILTSIKHYSYDKNGNITQVKEYDWVPYSTIPRDTLGKATGMPGGLIPKRIITNTYHCQTPGAFDTTTFDPDSYDQASAPSLLNALKVSQVGNNSQMLTRTEYSYDNPFSTGNLTQQRSWDSTKGPIKSQEPFLDDDNSIVTTTTYNEFGSPTVITDARQVQTQFTYGAINGVSNLYATEIKTALGTGVQRWEKHEYDFSTALITKVIDEDNDVTALTQYDVLGRPILMRAAEATPEQTEVSIQYFAAERRVVVRSDLEISGDGRLVTVQHYDQLGRLRLSRKLESFSTNAINDELAGVKVQTRYRIVNPCQPTNLPQCLADNAATIGNYVLVSNPYRASTSGNATSESTMGWKRARRDISGRMVETRNFAGAGLPAPWDTNVVTTGAVTTAYDTNFTTVTDEAGKILRSQLNGLGQLVRVDEPSDAANTLGNQATLYDYDALGNLKSVSQGGQFRSFNYSSLSRLISASHPESGTFNYEYDGNGNLTKKIDPRLVPSTSNNRTITMAYDFLGRLTSRTYNDGTPNVTYTYDDPNVDFSRGRLTAISSSVSAYLFDKYDSFGRVKKGTQITDGQSYTMHYAYNLAGSMVSQTYPSGRVVKNDYDDAGRIAGVKNDATNHYYIGGSSTDTTNRVQYSPAGAVSLMKLGNGLWESTSFNSRLQTTQITLGTSSTDFSKLKLDFTYGVVINNTLDTTRNNGNIESQSIVLSGLTLKQTYTYDELNRLKSAHEKNGSTDVWKQTYKYDRFGNRRFDRINTTLPVIPTDNDPTTNPTISEANNRITSSGYRYDNAGNLECDPLHPCGPGSPAAAYYEYDADNRMKTALGGAASGGSTYLYDGEGRRVKKIVGGANAATTVSVFNIKGQLVAEYGTAQPPSGETTSYLTSDHLRTPRVITRPNKSVSGRHDYQPFGEELAASTGRSAIPEYAGAADTLRQQFTQQERDSETNLDFFGARYYSSQYGRFTSPDEFQNDTHTTEPASWNLYVYVRNNPLRYRDPTGKEVDGTDLDDEQRAKLIEDWKKKTGFKDIQFVEKNGRKILKINEAAGFEGGSETARKELLKAQGSNLVFDLKGVDYGPESAEVSFGASGLPLRKPDGKLHVRIRLDFKDLESLEGDAAVKEADSIGMVAFHEIEHTLNGLTSDYTKPDPGDVERKYINPIRAELGLPERQNYVPNKFTKDGVAYKSLTYKTKDGAETVVKWQVSVVDGERKKP